MDKLLSFSSSQAILPQAHEVLAHLYNKTCAGNDFLGWVDLPNALSKEEIQNIESCANRLRAQSEVIVVIGIGGSYLGSRAVIDACTNPFDQKMIVYAGHHMDDAYHAQLLSYLNDHEYSLIVISKSGTTTEPKIAFDLLRAHAQKKYGAQAKDHIVAITDARKGDLRILADTEGYQTFIIPDDVGGRFSVFTPCGLLPIACAGIAITDLIEGARRASESAQDELALHYASTRYALFTQQQKTVEALVSFAPALGNIAAWRQQLFGESEGKAGTGILPIGLQYSTDLHSMGQYMQEGPRNLMETFVRLDDAGEDIGLRLANTACMLGTKEAHEQGNIPVATRTRKNTSPKTIGAFLYICMKSCAISALLLGVNPFDQPGVEAYKKAMKAKMS